MSNQEESRPGAEDVAARELAYIASFYSKLEAESPDSRKRKLAELLRYILSRESRTSFLAGVAHAIGFSSFGEEDAADAIIKRAISELFSALLELSPHFEAFVELARIEPVAEPGRLEFALVLPEDMETGQRLAEFLVAARSLWGGPLTAYVGGAVIVVHEGDGEEELRLQWEQQVLSGETAR